MSLEGEDGIPEDTKRFSVPDESKRIEDPALAEAMAHGSNDSRSRAAKLRKSANAHYALGNADTGQQRALAAEGADWTAEYQEEWAGIEHRVSQMDVASLASRKEQLLQAEVKAKNVRTTVTNQLSPGAKETLHHLEQIHVELSAIEKRLTE